MAGRFYYDNGNQQANVVSKLKLAIDSRNGLSVVIGDIGVGKTTLARKLLAELDEDRYEAALLVITNSLVSSEWLLRKIAIQLGISQPELDKSALLGQIHHRLQEIHEQGKTAVILMDEVQMLKSAEIMEDFRRLLNMNSSGQNILNLVLFGLSALEDVLSLDEPLGRRIATNIRVAAFSEQDTRDYILHRLSVAGATVGLFTEKALAVIYKFSNGIPRLINTICDNALLEGFLFKSSSVDEKMITAVAIDLGLSVS
ncbi:MAG: AAA family ATPase [Actinomycetota bacterium]|nr:AAA family ATPase [Nitrospiraceae bacterium]MDA8157519.1 AAA family ATPase [Actinomycetota bacterium]